MNLIYAAAFLERILLLLMEKFMDMKLKVSRIIWIDLRRKSNLITKFLIQ